MKAVEFLDPTGNMNFSHQKFNFISKVFVFYRNLLTFSSQAESSYFPNFIMCTLARAHARAAVPSSFILAGVRRGKWNLLESGTHTFF